MRDVPRGRGIKPRGSAAVFRLWLNTPDAHIVAAWVSCMTAIAEKSVAIAEERPPLAPGAMLHMKTLGTSEKSWIFREEMCKAFCGKIGRYLDFSIPANFTSFFISVADKLEKSKELAYKQK